jgi:hypothetical protein
MHKIKSFLQFIKEQNRNPILKSIHFAMGRKRGQKRGQERGNSRMRNEDVGSIPESIDFGMRYEDVGSTKKGPKIEPEWHKGITNYKLDPPNPNDPVATLPSRSQKEFSARLMAARKVPLTNEEKERLKENTYPTQISQRLIDDDNLPPGTPGKGVHDPKLQERIDALDKITNRPLGASAHLFSGLSFDPRKHLNKNIFSSPAFISATTHHGIAKSFATGHNPDDADPEDGDFTKKSDGPHDVHIMHIHAAPNDPGVALDTRVSKGEDENRESRYPEENEVLIPRRAKLKYSHTTTHDDKTEFGKPCKINVHHFTVHHPD